MSTIDSSRTSAVTIDSADTFNFGSGGTGLQTKTTFHLASSSFSGSITVKSRPIGGSTFSAISYKLQSITDTSADAPLSTAAITGSCIIEVETKGSEVALDCTDYTSGSMVVTLDAPLAQSQAVAASLDSAITDLLGVSNPPAQTDPLVLGASVVDGFAFPEATIRALSLGYVYEGTGEDIENTIGNVYGYASLMTWDGTSDTADGAIVGARFASQSKPTNSKAVGYLHGMNYDAIHRGTGDVYEIAGGYGGAQVRTGAAGHISSMFGLEGYVTLEGGAGVTVDEATGVIADVEKATDGVTVDKAYQFWAGRMADDFAVTAAYPYYYNGAAGRKWYVLPNGSMYSDGTVTAQKGVIYPSADPHIAGAWWDNAGTLTKSAG